MTFWYRFFALFLLWSSAHAQEDKNELPLQATSLVSATLLSDSNEWQPHGSGYIGIHFSIAPGWHIYWKNPGNSGAPAKVEWESGEGITFAPLQWPYPTTFHISSLTNFGYEEEVVLPLKVQYPPEGPELLELNGEVSFLVCKDECLKGKTEIHKTLKKSSYSPSLINEGRQIEQWLNKVPPFVMLTGTTAKVEGNEIFFSFPSKEFSCLSHNYSFIPSQSGLMEYKAPLRVVEVSEQATTLSFQRPSHSKPLPAQLQGVLGCENAPGVQEAVTKPIEVTFPFPMTESLDKLSSAPLAAPEEGTTLSGAIWGAFLGGLILNLMPCVFPILALKLFHVAELTKRELKEARIHALLYTGGIVLSFLALAGILFVFRGVGTELGWGFQLQSPYFVAFMILFLFIWALHFFGIFHVGHKVQNLAGSIEVGSGARGAFLSGALAVFVASPCTAPFMATALGWALTVPFSQGIMVFLFLGIGMAVPYLVLTFSPPLMRLLPRPGAWMQTVQHFMAFPLFGTVIWLLWVLGAQKGTDAICAMLVVLLSVALLLWGITQIRGRSITARLLQLLLVLGCGTLAMTGSIVIQHAKAPTVMPSSVWAPYSEASLQHFLAEGTPVFIDFTAAWCVTCQVNKKAALEREEVLQAFAQKGVSLMRADYTNEDPAITEKLSTLRRSGVPVYVLYVPGKSPVLLPSLLTPQLVKDALAQALPDRK